MKLKSPFSEVPYSKNWHPNKNTLTPDQVSKWDDNHYYFVCDKQDCKHEFSAAPHNISQGKGCPFCANKRLCKDDNCKPCWEKSFASSQYAQFWDCEVNKGNPRDYFMNCNSVFGFICDKCKHSFNQSPNNISNPKVLAWCPFCASKRLCKDDNCKPCWEKSFASSQYAQFWDCEVNKGNPRDYFMNCNWGFGFICDKYKHSFKMPLNSVTQGSWCSFCKKKSEGKLNLFFINNDFKVNKQLRFDWCRNPDTGYYFPVDFQINENIILELDGPQHFIQVSNWRDPVLQQERDMYKMECAINNGFHVIRILQTDVWYDKNNWGERLIDAIHKLEKKSEQYETEIICIGDEEVYGKYTIVNEPNTSDFSF